MLIGYARVSKADGSQSLDLQRDALCGAGVDAASIYQDFASGVRDDRPGLENCLRALRSGDLLVVWKLDRLGRNLTHLVNTVANLSVRGVGLRVLAGQGAQLDTTTAAGRLVFGIFAALAEFEGELISERTMAGHADAKVAGNSRCRKLRCTSHRPPSRWSNTVCSRRAYRMRFPITAFAGRKLPSIWANGDDLENADRIVGHESMRTTQLYNRVEEELSLDESEQIHI